MTTVDVTKRGLEQGRIGMPAFSVVIPTFGRPKFLTDALRSVAQQTLDSVEVIVVDDASPEPVRLARMIAQ